MTPADLAALPGVTSVEQQGPRTLLRCSDSDLALRSLLAARPDVHDIEITGANLEDAFLSIAAQAAADTQHPQTPRPNGVPA